MKKLSITIFCLVLFIKVNSQNKLAFYENELNDETIIVTEIAETILSKKDTINNIDWYKNNSNELIHELRKFEIEIENSKNEIDYYIDKIVAKSKNIIYSIHYFIKENEEQFSKIYFLFKYNDTNANEDLKVDEVKIDGKEIIEKMKKEWISQMGPDIPPPTLPPSKEN